MNKFNEVCTIQVKKGFFANVNEDGSIVIYMKDIFIPKEGDFIFIGGDNPFDSSIIAVYKHLKCNGEHIEYFTYCSISSSGLFFEFERGHYSDNNNVRLATEEEKKILISKMESKGLIWNPETKIVDKIYIPKDGDYIYIETDTSSYLEIYKSEEIIDNVSFIIGYCYLSLLHDSFSCEEVKINSEVVTYIKPATQFQINKLNEEIDNNHLVWRSDLKKICRKPEIDKLAIFWQNGKTTNHLIDILTGIVAPVPIYKCTNGTWDNCILYDEEIFKEMINYRENI